MVRVAFGCLPSYTRPSEKTNLSTAGARPLLSFNKLAATGINLARRISHAFFTAAPFRSVPQEAAVAEVLGTLSVLVGMTRTFSDLRPSSFAAIAAMLV